MKLVTLFAALLALATSPALGEQGKPVVRPVFTANTTASGQPITLPKISPQVVVSTYDIPPGAKLPVHKHAFPRYAYVLSGVLRVTNEDTKQAQDYAAGQFIVEAIGQWHFGQTIGAEPVRLLVIDQVEEGQANTELKEP